MSMDPSFTEIYVDQKHHQTGLTKSMVSSKGVHMVVLNECTIFGQHILVVLSIRLGDMQFGQQKFK